MKNACLICLTTALLLPPTADSSDVKAIKGSMPNRISMNVTVPKQTQGATFGEKVNAGLHAAGSARSQGASRFVIECGRAACAVMFPDGRAYRVDTRRSSLQTMLEPPATALRHDALGQGASLLGGVLPRGAAISAAVSSVGNLAGGGGGAAAASYAATGRTIREDNQLRASVNRQGEVDVLDPLVDGNYRLTIVIDQPARVVRDTLNTQVRAAMAEQVRMEVDFGVQGTVMNPLFEAGGNKGDVPVVEASRSRE